jgi:hypothetical protein
MDDKAKAERVRELLAEVDNLCGELSANGWEVGVRTNHLDLNSVCRSAKCFSTEFWAEKTTRTAL